MNKYKKECEIIIVCGRQFNQKYLLFPIIMPYNTYIDLGVYFNGRMPVSKTVNVGSTPSTPAK